MCIIDIINKVIYTLFVAVGGNFYLNWLLVTNPTSKNPLIKWCWGVMCCNSTWNVRDRYIDAYVYGVIHIIGCVFMIYSGGFWTICNFVINVYPILVQLYIGFRCYRIMQYKKLRSK